MRLGFAAVGNLVELRPDVGRLVEFDADFERGPHAVVAVQDPWSFFGVRQGIDRELRRAYWTVEAVASTPKGASAGLDIYIWGAERSHRFPSLRAIEPGVSNKQLGQ